MHRRPRSRPRRSPREWSIRIVAGIAAAILGYASTAATLGYTLRTSDPARAHELAPHDGRVTALLAQKMSGPEATSIDRSRANALARTALWQDPTAVVAVSTLGLNAQVRGDTTSARRFFTYAERLSRRDLPAQLWLIENAVAHNEVTVALRHYDIALRTSRAAPDLLFPVLGSAIAEPDIRAALTQTLAGRPIWSTAFVEYVAAEGPDPRASAILLVQLAKNGVGVPVGSKAALVGRLVSGGIMDAAWALYASYHPGVNRRMSRDPTFMADPMVASPFDWVPVNDAGISVSIQQDERGGLVDLTAPPSVGGPMLQQLQLLPPGDYSLIGHSVGIDQQEQSKPFWELTCKDGRQIGRVDVLNSAQTGGVFSGRFRVPSGCPIQILKLVARPSDTPSGLTGQIDRLRLAPAS